MKRHAVLVVDDEPASVRAVTRTLANEHLVRTAASGEEGLALLAQESAAFVIADHRMPGMTGTEFLARCAELYPESIRVLLTGYTDVETVIGAINAGQVYFYVTKPWEPHDLRLVVRRGLERFDADADRRRLLHELEQACARIRRESEQKTRLLTLASHELGTPLHVLLNVLDMLSAGPLPEVARSWVETAQRNAQWLARGLSQMTAAGRTRSGAIRLHRTAVDLRNLNLSLVEQLRARLGARRLEILVECSPGLAPVDADPKWLRRAIANLLSNAARFTPDGGTICLTAIPVRDGVMVSVRDTGVGVEPGCLTEIFEPFSAAGGDPFLHASGSLEFGARGLGLGLAITQAVVALHGGRLEVASEPQLGSCFAIVLPAASEDVLVSKIG
jgi:signal transduction histidine kinase